MNEGEQNAVKSKRKYLKIGAIAAGAVVFLLMIFFGLSKYGEWNLERNIKKIIENENRPYLEDTYGGKTPKETLELFIAAVEKEDFDLASKYFVLSKQGEWRDKLVNGKKNNNIEWFITELKKENKILDYTDPAALLGNRQLYTVGDKMSITFIKYPRGIWKIQSL